MIGDLCTASSTLSAKDVATATFIKNFKWTNADQNSVANDITNNGMTDAEAAKKWADANPDTWKAWIP